MPDSSIQFRDGAVYERMMGRWSQLVGDIFIEWLAPHANFRWLDVGCGNGAFTQLIADLCAPAAIDGIDPSKEQLGFARERPAARLARFQHGNAMDLPYPDNSFDASVMALVIFFVPDPRRGVAEMIRVTRPGGIVAAYAWDVLRGGFPVEIIQDELQAFGIAPVHPPSAEASKMENMRSIWSSAGLEEIETKEISVQRTFASFDDFWTTSAKTANIRPQIDKMTPGDVELLKARLQVRLPTDSQGRIRYGACANAVKGRVPR